MNKKNNSHTHHGSGSSENLGQSRDEQMNRMKDAGSSTKEEIAQQAGENESRMGSIKETGGLSGRDDSSGGSGDRMEDENTGAPTN